MLVLEDLLVFIEPFNFSCFSITGWGIDLDYCNVEWFALETNSDHSVIFETASKYCISDSFVDHDGYSISSEGFLPTVVDVHISYFDSNPPLNTNFHHVPMTFLFLHPNWKKFSFLTFTVLATRPVLFSFSSRADLFTWSHIFWGGVLELKPRYPDT